MLVASLYLVTTFITAFFARPTVRSLVSLDWSGYVVVSDFSSPEPVITGVSGSWSVPRVYVSDADTFSAVWIGIGGQLDSSLIQVGTEQDSVSGQDAYSAWYELLPYDSITITTMDVSPGDKITASISLLNWATDDWLIQIHDVTKGQVFQKNLSYGSSRLSAEWVVERPTVNNRLSTLADFGNITFTDSQATMNVTVGEINSFPFARILMHDRQNRQLVDVSPLSSDGSSFTVDYLSIVAASQAELSFLEDKIVATPQKTCLTRSVQV